MTVDDYEELCPDCGEAVEECVCEDEEDLEDVDEEDDEDEDEEDDE